MGAGRPAAWPRPRALAPGKRLKRADGNDDEWRCAGPRFAEYGRERRRPGARRDAPRSQTAQGDNGDDSARKDQGCAEGRHRGGEEEDAGHAEEGRVGSSAFFSAPKALFTRPDTAVDPESGGLSRLSPERI